MRRIALVSALVLAPLSLAAETDAEREERCAKQAAIFGKAAELRLARVSEKKAGEELRASVKEELHGSIAPIVGFVYTLPRKELKNEDIAEAFVAQCAAFDPNEG